MSGGQSYKRSLALALGELGAENTLITSPNGILATEYARAIKKLSADIKILPVQRVGGGYGDSELKENFSSASAIRANLSSVNIAGNVPDYVAKSLEKISLNGVKERAGLPYKIRPRHGRQRKYEAHIRLYRGP